MYQLIRVREHTGSGWNASLRRFLKHYKKQNKGMEDTDRKNSGFSMPFPERKAVMGNKTGNNIIRLLRADEIECRASLVSEKGLSLLLYKDARVDQRILDETFGIFGWKRSHQCINDKLYCTVEIYNKETGEWVAKQDVGTNGEQQKEKSQASDSFKRACFNWGIGRELYSAPFIWVPASKTEIQKKGKKYCCNERFTVSSIEYNAEREITELVIKDGQSQTVYELKPRTAGWKQAGKTRKDAGQQHVSSMQMENLEKELQRTGVSMDAVKERYRIEDPEQMSGEVYRKVMSALAKTKPKDAA